MADRLMPLARSLLEAWYDEPYDYLGQLFSEQNCAIEGKEVGQAPPSVMTRTDELPLFRGHEGEQRWEEDYHKR